VSFDITNMYTNILTDKLGDIIDFLSKERLINEELRHEIIKISQLII